MSSWAATRDGFREGAALGVTYAVLAWSFGHYATQVLGFPADYVVAQTVFMFAAQSQLGALKVLYDGGGAIAALLIAIVINARFMLMSASLGVHFRNQPMIPLLIASFFVGNGTFAIATRRFARTGGQLSYFIAMGSCGYIGFVIGVIAGAMFGDMLPAPLLRPAGFALPAFLASMVVASFVAAPRRLSLLAPLTAGASLAIAWGIGPNLALVVGPIIGATVLTWWQHRRPA